MSEFQELKEATELWSRLQTVSEPQGQSFVGIRGGQGDLCRWTSIVLSSGPHRSLSFGPTVLRGPLEMFPQCHRNSSEPEQPGKRDFEESESDPR